ncbi:hypothetical protein [Streptomyces palmae]|nr:hypothetical protein [Streptomyces palmae]
MRRVGRSGPRSATVVEGFEDTVTAFQGMLRGENTGKMIVRLGE